MAKAKPKVGAYVLVSWVAVNNDPFERNADGAFRKVDGAFVPGPTLTLLENARSPYAGKVSDVVLLRQTHENKKAHKAFLETRSSLQDRHGGISLHDLEWSGRDPTDHAAIFTFIRRIATQIRAQFPEAPLLIHVSPGTPAMQTIWVLACEMGIIEGPFELVKSYRERDRLTGELAVAFNIGIDGLYKALKGSKPVEPSVGEEDLILTDPSRLQSPKLKRLYCDAQRFARLNVPVLIRGERGTGKTSLATWIRLNSPFRQKEKDASWPSVACGQYSEETMRAELFGYRKGAFTGASEDRAGLLTHANGDTLFLDEIGDISRGVQRLLIKALEEKRFLPLGAKNSAKSNFRLISATNIEEEALRERLDPDFLDRVRALELVLPPLRETKEDLPWLWRSVFAEALRRSIPDTRDLSTSDSFHEKVIQNLRKLPLRGNIRDLFSVAYPMIAVLYNDPRSGDEAINFAFASAQRHCALESGESDEPTKTVLAAFLSGRSMESVLEAVPYVETKVVEAELRRFMATGLLGLKVKGRDLANACDVSERTLRNWR